MFVGVIPVTNIDRLLLSAGPRHVARTIRRMGDDEGGSVG